jgi:hypothetical protein
VKVHVCITGILNQRARKESCTQSATRIAHRKPPGRDSDRWLRCASAELVHGKRVRRRYVHFL